MAFGSCICGGSVNYICWGPYDLELFFKAISSYKDQTSEEISIAVLPFTNMSADPEQEYFADGISEDLITDLSKIPDLLVISRLSSFTYKGKNIKIQQIARGAGCALRA